MNPRSDARITQKQMLEHAGWTRLPMAGGRLERQDEHLADVAGIGANFFKSRFTNCGFVGVDLSSANFGQGELVDCDFDDCIMELTRYDKASLLRCSWKAPRLVSGFFLGARLNQCRFYARPNLARTLWEGAEVEDSRFERPFLVRAHLGGAVFRRCGFTNADLTDALLAGSTFVGCDLTGNNLTPAQREAARFEDCTGLSAG